MNPTLQVLSVEGKNILGARRVVIQPGKITTISGRNGTGKSSALAVIQAAFGGGSLANFARIGKDGKPEEPEIVVLLGEPGQPERYRVTKTAKNVKVKERVDQTAAFRDALTPPQTLIDSFSDQKGANPVRFLTATEKELVQLVLEAIPIKLDRERLEAILGEDSKHVAGREMLAQLHPLEEIAATREALFVTRTGVNRDAKNAEAAVDRLQRATPALILADDAKPQLADVEEKAKALRDVLSAERARISADREADIKAATIAFETAKAAAAEVYKAALAEAENVRLRSVAEANEKASEDTDAMRAETDEVFALEARAKELKAAIEQAVRDKTLSEQAKIEQEAAARHRTHSERLSMKIEALDELRRSLATNLPVRGLEIRDKGVWLDGVPERQANTARRVDMAVDLALLRTRGTQLPYILLDGAEAMDTAVFALLVERVKQEPDVQLFVGRVSDSAITVESDGEVAGLVEVGSEAVRVGPPDPPTTTTPGEPRKCPQRRPSSTAKPLSRR